MSPPDVPALPVVPGYLADAFVARGGHGEVWRGRHLGSGRTVALKRIPGAGAGGLRLRAEVGAALTLGGPHVVAVHDLHLTGDGAVLVTDWAAGGSLADLLGARTRLTPGETVTLLVPLGTVLAEAHARLLVHGDVSPGNVLLTGDGRPMLADWGLARAVTGIEGDERDDPGSEGTPGFTDPAAAHGPASGPPADVAGLAAVAYAALAGRPPWSGEGSTRPALQRLAPLVPPGLAAVIEAGLAVRPADRPSAAEFAAAARDACDAVALTLPRRTGSSEPARTAGRSVHRPDQPAGESQQRSTARPGSPGGDPSMAGRRGVAAILGGIAGAVLLAVVAGIAWGRSGADGVAARALPARQSPSAFPSPASPPSASPPSASPPVSPGSTDPPHGPGRPVAWRRIVQALAARRARAITQGRPAVLTAVYTPASPALRRDGATIRHLRAEGLRADGLHVSVIAVRPEHEAPGPPAATPGKAVVEVEDALSSYRLVDVRTGRTVAMGAPRPREAMRFTLVRGPEGWRIADVRPG